MIASLKGVVSEKLTDKVIIDVSGVGYGIFVINDDYSKLKLGEKTSLCIYEYVREQAHDLFGFLSRETQDIFEKLLEVNGVGPKMALSLLSIGQINNIVDAITSGDIDFLQRASGVGRRVAERVVIELRDKIGILGGQVTTKDLLNAKHGIKDEAIEALISLGYTSSDAAKALTHVDKKLPTEERVKLALKGK